MEMAHAKVIIYLLLNGAPVDVPDIAGSTALHHVAMNNMVADVLKAIFIGRPDPNARDRYGSTPLHYAVMQSQAEVVERCLANGGDLDVAEGDGITPSSLLIHATPAVAAIVGKYKREKLGTSELVEDRGKCVVCGKTGRVSKCARCRLTRYCGPECQGE
jgi:Ankyrin repeats (3 copies)